MFRKVKVEDIVVQAKEGKLTFSYTLENEEHMIKAAGRMKLGIEPRICDKNDKWLMDGNRLIYEVEVKGEQGISFGAIRKAFEEMVS